MAIAFDTSGAAQSATGSEFTCTLSLTVASGASLWVGVSNANASGDAATVTWNTTEALTKAVSRTPGGFTTDALWYLANPTPGTHNIVATFSSLCESTVIAISLTGTDASPLGATASNGGTATSGSTSVTTTTDNSVVVDMITVNGNQALTATGSGQTIRQDFAHNVSSGWEDGASTMTTTTAGSYAPAYSWSPSRIWNQVAVEVKAATTSGPANLKTWDGLAKASVKTMDGLALASVKTWNGLS